MSISIYHTNHTSHTKQHTLHILIYIPTPAPFGHVPALAECVCPRPACWQAAVPPVVYYFHVQ
ncbi:hypothetical protein EON63_07945 [archaeon]|nr:MAG: hypothetical protein EON63_07945 [archaeon]